jgi:hypothetical protein
MKLLASAAKLRNYQARERALSGLVAAIFSVAVIAAFTLLGFGVRFALGTEYRRNGTLMIIAGLVILANVLIWTV